MPHFVRADDCVYVNLDLVAKVVADNVDDPSWFDCFDANDARIARVTDEWAFDLMRETAPVVPARPGETAFIVRNTKYDDRPELADVKVEERAVVAWRVIADRSAEPVFAEHPYFDHMMFFRTPSGRLRCKANGEEFADIDELRALMLRKFQGEWDREHLNSAHKTGRVAPDTNRAAMH